MPFLLKVFISSIIIAAVSELSKRSALLGAVFASLPLTSLMVMIWLYLDTRDVEQVAKLSTGIFWALIPSFLFLLSLPYLLRHGVRFPWAMLIACALMACGYTAYVWGMRKIGVEV